MREGDQELIDAMFRVRVRNNAPWKKIMEIALRCAPDETRAVFREITENDSTVVNLMRYLGQP